MFTRPFFVERETIAVALLFIKWTLHDGAGQTACCAGRRVPSSSYVVKNNTMRREQIEEWIAEGYNILDHKKPKVVEGDIWEYLNQCDGHGTDVYALSELARWSDRELAELDLRKYTTAYGQLGEKQFLRNEAIRTKEFDKYEAFLRLFFPDSVEKEIEEARFLSEQVKRVTKEEMQQWVVTHHINVLLSDLYCLDEGAILTGLVLPSEEVVSYTDGGLQDTMDCHVTPMEFFSHAEHDHYWIDPRVKGA